MDDNVIPNFAGAQQSLTSCLHVCSGAEFEVVEAGLEEQMAEQYTAAASMWNQLRREFLYAAEQAGMAERDAGLPKKRGSLLWRSFWASHQRFFRHMCMAAKVLSQRLLPIVASLSSPWAPCSHKAAHAGKLLLVLGLTCPNCLKT